MLNDANKTRKAYIYSRALLTSTIILNYFPSSITMEKTDS